jgi:hypothetical protein
MQIEKKRSIRLEVPKVGAFYLLAFAISALLWSPLIFLPQAADKLGFLVLLGAFGPTFAALITIGWYEGSAGLRSWLKRIFTWRIQPWWYLLGGLLLPLVIALAHLAIYLLLFGAVEMAGEPPWYTIAVFFPLNVLITAPITSGMEEVGWQGLAMPELLRRFSPLSANILHGLIWAAWHIPLYFTSAWDGKEPLLLMFTYTIPLAMILTWLTNKSRGSVLPAILLHNAGNLYGSYFTSETIFASPLTTHFSAIKTAIYWGIAIFLLVTTRGQLGYRQEQAKQRGND